MPQYDFIVLGAGISGLVLARELVGAGKNVLVLERHSKPGGVLQSIHKDGMVWDRSAHTIACDHEVTIFFEKWGLSDILEEPSSAAKVRQLVIDGSIHNVESHPLKIMLSKFLSPGAKLKIIRELFKKPIDLENPTVSEFFHYHFGSEITRNVISAVFSGIYAGDIEKMEMRSVMAKIYDMEQEKGSLIRALVANAKGSKGRRIVGVLGGINVLMQRLVEGLDIRFKEEVVAHEVTDSGYKISSREGIYFTKQVVSTLPAYSLAKMVDGVDPKLSDLLTSVPYSSLALLHVSCESSAIRSQPAFGFLCSQYSGSRLAGAIYNSQVFPSRGSNSREAFTIFMRYENGIDLDEASGQTIVEFQRLLDLDERPTLHAQTLWEKGIPQMNKPYGEKRAEILERADFEVSGSFISGVSLSDCIKYNVSLAKVLAET